MCLCLWALSIATNVIFATKPEKKGRRKREESRSYIPTLTTEMMSTAEVVHPDQTNKKNNINFRMINDT